MDQGTAKQSEQMQTILWLSMLMSVGVIFAMVFVVVVPKEGAPLEINSQIVMFGVIGLMLAAASFAVPKFLKPNIEPSMTPEQVAQAKFVPFILRMAVGESVGVLGFVTAMGAGKHEVAVPFFIASFFCILMAKPKK